jgi:hypothetical protein
LNFDDSNLFRISYFEFRISGLSGLGDNVELLNMVFPLIAWAVVILLLSLPGLWFTVFAFSLLGHLTQIVFKKTSLRVDRS